MKKIIHSDTNNKKQYVLFIGSIFEDKEIATRKAISAAANHWQKSFILNNEIYGLKFALLGHMPEPIWPKGKLIVRPSTVKHVCKSSKQYGVIGIQLPFLRNNLLTYNYKRKLNHLLKQEGLPYVVIAYNLYPHTYNICRYLNINFGIPWVVMVADSPAQGVFGSIRKHDKLLEEASGRVFFSWEYYQKFKHLEPTLHFEGGVDIKSNDINRGENANSNDRDKSKFIIMYTGSRGRHAGLDDLISAMHKVENKNVILWITGQGKTNNLTVKHENIIDHGYVNREKLEFLMDQADCFICPYDISYEPNKYNFPSKLLEYLSYGKPIISTAPPGISPEYFNVVNVAQSNKPGDLAKKIDDVSGMSDSQKLTLSNNILAFASKEKSWARQCEKLNHWIESKVL